MAASNRDSLIDLEAFLAPLGVAEFMERHWEERYVHLRREPPAYCRDLMSIADVDRYIALARQNPSSVVSVVRLGQEMRQLHGAEINARQLYHAFHGGSTLLLEEAQAVWAPFAHLTRALERMWSAHVAINVYISPPNSQGAHIHPDSYDVFALQLEGAKRWWVYDDRFYQTVEGMRYHRYFQTAYTKPILEREDVELPIAEEPTLTVGDLLYLPRGTFHKAAAVEDTPSLHLAIAVKPIYWVEVLKAACEVASTRFPEFCRVLPPGFEARESSELALSLDQTYRRALELLASEGLFEMTLDVIKRERMDRAWRTGDDHFQQLLDLPDIDQETLLERRDGQFCQVSISERGALLRFRDGQMNGPPQLAPAFEFIADRTRFQVTELPGRLDDQSRLVLVRRLIREGVLRVASNA